jgi:HPt (histidine-containing phosphotransfer) domain-containing protein
MEDEHSESKDGSNTARIFSGPRLCENFMGNSELVHSLLRRFIERTERQIADIPGLAERGDWETAVRETHTIKGSARNLSALDLGDAAMRWEETCGTRDPSAVKAQGLEFAAAFARFKTLAEQYLSERESHEP